MSGATGIPPSSGFHRFDFTAAAVLVGKKSTIFNDWSKKTKRRFWESGMNTLVAEMQVVKATAVVVNDDTLTVELADGRTLSVPIAWYPRLLYAKQAEREHWEWIGDGEGIHWSDLDEDISIEGLLLGRRSGESQRSLQRWLEARTKSDHPAT
jgi:hypothetical protein